MTRVCENAQGPQVGSLFEFLLRIYISVIMNLQAQYAPAKIRSQVCIDQSDEHFLLVSVPSLPLSLICFLVKC